MKRLSTSIMAQCFCLLLIFNSAQAQLLNESSAYLARSIEGSASWVEDATSGDFIYDNAGETSTQRAIIYSNDTYQSDFGFRLTIEFTTGSLGVDGNHNFSFGLISDDTDLSAYTGFNPFGEDSSVYSVGANLTIDEDLLAQGMNFTNGSEPISLDKSGTRTQFKTGASTKIFIEIGEGGFWSYYIDGIYEESGVIAAGIDLSKNYHVAVFGQDDNGGEKSIQSIKLEKAPAPGGRAAKKVKGTWLAGAESSLAPLKSFKTLDYMTIGINWGAAYAAYHPVPNKLMEIINGNAELTVCPTWGDLSLDEPEVDDVMDRAKDIRTAGFMVQGYSNCQNFMGGLGDDYLDFQAKWKAWCDTNAVAQEFINSQPFHTGIWNANTQSYVDATSTHPERKYMFCYAEFIIKENSLRYGPYIDRWVYDSGGDLSSRGDNVNSGIIEDQRLYQAFANASRAGNPDIAISFNNGRSSYKYFSYPFAQAVRSEDFTFGHAFGGNNNHAEKVDGNQFNLNYQHVTRMMETEGNVFEGNDWTWDDQIVGNFNSKLSTTSWNSGPAQAWENADFLQWNLEALKAGGSMSWSGSTYKSTGELREWAYDLIKLTDDYLAIHQYPDVPNWARAYTNLPEAEIGVDYYYELVDGSDFWDPEGDNMSSITLLTGAPSWLSIKKDSLDSAYWILSGMPTETSGALYVFEIKITDIDGNEAVREVELQVSTEVSTVSASSVYLLPSNIILMEGDNERLSANISPVSASNQKVSFSSSDTSIATVSARGIVSAKTVGNVTITVKTDDGGHTAECVVVITPKPVNIASIGIATQSSTQGSAVAENAIDGILNGALALGSVSQTTNEDNPWWQIEFDTDKRIDSIVIWNRTDACCMSELSDFTVDIINQYNSSVVKTEFTGEFPDSSVTIVAGGGIEGRFVKIQLAGTGSLALSEVQIFGSDGTNGVFHIEAEDFTEMSGVVTEDCSDGTLNLGYINNSDWARYENVFLGSGIYSFEARISSKSASGNIEIRKGSITGDLLGVCTVESTGNWNTWKTTEAFKLDTVASGLHDIYLVFTGGSGALFNINHFTFTLLEYVSYVEPSTNIKKTFSDVCKIYPIPATNSLNYEFKNNTEYTSIAIYSLLGKEMVNMEIKNSDGRIDISRLPQGVYLLKIMGSEMMVTRFIKQ